MKMGLHGITRYLPVSARTMIRNMLIKAKAKPMFDVSQIALTYRCNARCKKCSTERYDRTGKEISTEEAMSIITTLAEMRTRKLGFFGGEPTLREDLDSLIAYADSLGIPTELFTNGYLLDKERVGRLKKAGLSMASISLDASTREEHDALRSLPGSYDRAVQAIRNCSASGIRTIINTVSSRQAVRSGDLRQVIRLGKRLGAWKVKLIPPTMVGCWIDAQDEMLEEEDRKEIVALTRSPFVYSEITTKYGKYYRQCKCRTHSRIYISPYGDVQPCWAVPVSFGNIRKQDLFTIIKQMKSFDYGTTSYDCITNDASFRKKHLRGVSRYPIDAGRTRPKS